MAYSVRFYIDNKKIPAYSLEEVTVSHKKFGKFVPEENYFEFKVENHLMAHPDEFIPLDFQQKIRKLVTKVTMQTSNYGRYGINGGDTRVPVLIGSSLISFERNEVMIVGKNFKLMVKAYMLFCKYNGQLPDYQESQKKQKFNELQRCYAEQLKENRNLISKLEIASAKNLELEQKINIKKGSLIWFWKNL